MKKTIMMILASAALLTSSVTFAQEAASVKDSKNNSVASYKIGQKKETISGEDVIKYFKKALDTQPNSKDKSFADFSPEEQENLVRGYINNKLLEQEVKSANIESSKEFQEKIALYQDQIAKKEIIEKVAVAAINDDVIKAAYDELIATLKDSNEVKVSHILIEANDAGDAQIKDIAKELANGRKFSELAKKYSKDEGSKAKGGDVGYVRKGQLEPIFETKVLSMKQNEVSKPFKTRFGWHIAKVTNIRPVVMPKLEEEKVNITQKLQQEAVNKYINDLSTKAEVTITLPSKAEPAEVAPAAAAAAPEAAAAPTSASKQDAVKK
jgi:peptidyl-prolyl cis-trans isomerase C